MTPSDKQELENLKSSLQNLESNQSTVVTKILSDINLSLTFESILLYRYLNELFLYISTHKTVDNEDFKWLKRKLIRQIDSAIGRC